MRDPCLDCYRKHLGQAAALANEALQGYPWYQWLAVGHLAEAADEVVLAYPELADRTRRARLEYMEDLTFQIPFQELVEAATSLEVMEDVEVLSVDLDGEGQTDGRT